jgi:hypothetical protein
MPEPEPEIVDDIEPLPNTSSDEEQDSLKEEQAAAQTEAQSQC